MSRHDFSNMPRHDFCVMMNKRLNDAQKYLNSLGMQLLPYSQHNGVCDIYTIDMANQWTYQQYV